MRVFDFHGLTEAISELQGLLDAKSCNETSLDFKLGSVAEGEIANSEDEAEEDDGNAEMTETRPGIGMIVIDNVASIIGPELSKSQYQGTSKQSLGHDTKQANAWQTNRSWLLSCVRSSS
jgi:hypothetical protein